MVIDMNLSNQFADATAGVAVDSAAKPETPAPVPPLSCGSGAQGIGRVSCSVIGRDLNLVPVQVRKDLQYTGIIGKPKTGYSVAELIQAIETFLGWNNINEAFLVGAGNLGTALLGHERFSKFGLRIVAAFDTDPSKIGLWIHDKAVLPLDKLTDLAQRMSIHLGIITTPAEVAQAVADEMVKGRHPGNLEFCSRQAEGSRTHHCPQRRPL